MDEPSNKRFPWSSTFVPDMQEEPTDHVTTKTKTVGLPPPLESFEDHCYGEDQSGGDLGDSGMLDQQPTGRHLYDENETADNGICSNSLLTATMELLEKHIGEWYRPPFRNSHSTNGEELQNSVERNGSNTNSPCSSPYSVFSNSLSSSIDTMMEELLATPITPTSVEFKGPDGRPLGIEVAINAYRRGECSHGDVFKDCRPEKLASPTDSLASIPHTADDFKEPLPTTSKEFLLANPVDWHTAPKPASARDICAEEAQHMDQEPEEFYRSCPTGLTQKGKEREFDDTPKRQPTLPRTIEPGDKLLMQWVRTLPSKPLPSLPISRSPQNVSLRHTNEAKKPTAVQIPQSQYNSWNQQAIHISQSQNLPGPRVPQSALPQPYSPATPPYWAPLPYAWTPSVLESETHPALRQTMQYPPLRQQAYDNLSVYPVYQPSHYASYSSYDTGTRISPSLPPRRLDSIGRHSPVSSRRSSISMEKSTRSPSSVSNSVVEEAPPAQPESPAATHHLHKSSHKPGPSVCSTSMSVPLIFRPDSPAPHAYLTRHLTTTVIPTSPPMLGFNLPVRSSSLATRLVYPSLNTQITGANVTLADQAVAERYFSGTESKVAQVLGEDAVKEYKKEAVTGVKLDREARVEGAKRAVRRRSGEVWKVCCL